MEPRSPSPREAEQAISDTKEVARVIEQRPGWDDVRSEMGKAATIVEHEDGRVEAHINLRDPEAVKRYNGLVDPWRTAECDLGLGRSARVPTETLTNRDGRTVNVPAHLAERKAKKDGLVEKSRLGRFVVWSKAVALDRHVVNCQECGQNSIMWRSPHGNDFPLSCHFCHSKNVREVER